MSGDKKVALITGSTAGIGLSCAHALAKRGVNLIITGSRDAAACADTLEDLKRYDVRVDYVSADLAKLTDIERLWTTVLALYPDGIDILINNAGIYGSDTVDTLPDEVWDRLIAVNLSAPFHLTKRCLPAMKKKGWGRIVNVSSITGLISICGVVAYSATKHGLHGLTKGVALENAANGITCNAVCPAMTMTSMLEQFVEERRNQAASELSSEEFMNNSVEKAMPTKKVIHPDQVAELVEFLCLSSASSQMTGASYVIDGGYTAQ